MTNRKLYIFLGTEVGDIPPFVCTQAYSGAKVLIHQAAGDRDGYVVEVIPAPPAQLR